MSNPFEISRESLNEAQERRTEPSLMEPPRATVPSQNPVIVQINSRRKEEEKRPEHPTKEEKIDDYNRKLLLVQLEDLMAKREGRFVIPESVVAENDKILDARTDMQKKDLTVDQKKRVKDVERAVLVGDLYSLRAAVKSGKPEQCVIDTISKDLDLIGMKFDWNKENIKIDSEKNNAYPGLRLTVGTKSDNSAGALGPAEIGPVLTPRVGLSTRDNPLPAVHLEMHPEREEFPFANGEAAVLHEIGLTANARLSRRRPN